MTAFDPERGVLRLGHAALAVLARLAVAPTDPSLVDHATASPLAELRAAGLVGPVGIHPDVRPLAEVMGAPAGVLDLTLREGATPPRAVRLWLGAGIVVAAIPADDGAFDLAADGRGQAADLVGDLVGLTAQPAPVAPPVEIAADDLDVLLVGGAPADTPSTDAPSTDAPFSPAVAARALWRLAGTAGVLEVLDAGDEGLWRVEPHEAALRLVPADAAAVRAAVRALVASA
jgi:hypothetical protein